MHPLQCPARKIVDTIEYNLEQLDDLSIDELDLPKETTDALIAHMERLKGIRGINANSNKEDQLTYSAYHWLAPNTRLNNSVVRFSGSCRIAASSLAR